MAAVGVLAVPAVAMGQTPEPSDDLPLEEETSAVWNNTLFHTEEGGGYKSDGGTGAEAETTFHSDDQSQFISAGETILANTTAAVDMWYDQTVDYSFAQASLTSDAVSEVDLGASSTSLTYVRDQEEYTLSAQLTYDGTVLVDETSPTLVVPTGYQIYDAVTP